jgi:hypothetical protein
MSDMDAVTAAKSDQFNADDLIGSEMTVTVAEVIIRAGTEQPITVKLVGQSKVFRPCKTVARIMKAAWGPDSAVYPGRSMVIYTDPDVTWGGMKVGGIRVRAISHINDPLVIALQEKKGSKKITTVRPLKIEQPRNDDAPQADALIERINAIDTAPALVAFMRAETPAIDALSDPSAKRVFDAANARKNDLKAKRSSFEPEGPDDTQRGDGFDGTLPDDTRRARADEMLNQLRVAKNEAGLAAMEREYATDLSAMPEELQIEVETAIKEKRASFAG